MQFNFIEICHKIAARNVDAREIAGPNENMMFQYDVTGTVHRFFFVMNFKCSILSVLMFLNMFRDFCMAGFLHHDFQPCPVSPLDEQGICQVRAFEIFIVL